MNKSRVRIRDYQPELLKSPLHSLLKHLILGALKNASQVTLSFTLHLWLRHGIIHHLQLSWNDWDIYVHIYVNIMDMIIVFSNHCIYESDKMR